MTALILRRLGYAVSEAATIAEAGRHLDHCNGSGAPDWILLDLMLPDGCGIEVIREVRGRRLPSRICIITGCSGDRIREAQHAGAEHTFTKPLDMGRLVSLMAS